MTKKNVIQNAFALIGKQTEAQTVSTLPTARARKAIDFLANSTPVELAEKETPLRPLLQDLYNWDGGNHVNKPLIRAFEEAINTPGKYPQAVELTGFLVALSPLLEADQIARMYKVINDVPLAFAPAKYTIQLNSLLEHTFKEFSPERRERLALSLWEESHKGRWWNLTAGIEFEHVENIEYEPRTPEEIFDGIKKVFHNHRENLDWNPQYQTTFSTAKPSKDIALLAENYKDKLEVGEYVHPDIAVYLSGLPWLAPSQRPESPVGGLLKALKGILENIEGYKKPKKPRKFSELFPHVKLQAGAQNQYPFFPPLQNWNGQTIGEGRFQLIRNRVALAHNAKHMGNCTLSYADRMKKGEYALFYFETGGQEYNVSVVSSGDSWRVGEINTRHNRGQVAPEIRTVIQEKVHNLPKIDNNYRMMLDLIKDGKETSNSFEYSLY